MNLHILNHGYLSRKFKAAAVTVAIMSAPLALSAQHAQAPGNTQPPSPPQTEIPVAAVIMAPPPESEPQPAQAHRFTHIQSFVPLFQTADERQRNIFFSPRSRDAIREFRILTNSTERVGPLTRDEQRLLTEIRTTAAPFAKKYRIPQPVAATLVLAARQTGTDFESLVTRLQENSGNVSNVNPARLRGDNVYKFNVSTWLYLVKTYGAKHGLGFFADNITVGASALDAAGRPTVRVHVADPAVLRQIVAMRNNPRISTLMGAEYVAHETETPQTAYRGMNYVYDVAIAQEQTALMTIGFDLGTRGADGIRGPLAAAAKQEFTLLIQPLLRPGETVDTALQAVARQAVEDSQRYSTIYSNITPATAFAVRHAARVADVDFGYLMQLAGAESGFDAGISASTSSATGLFQFIDNTWLISLYKHGAKYGLNDIASRIEVQRNAAGEIISADIADPFVERYALGLRTDPRIMALMGAEFAKENREALQSAMPRRDITRTDQYLAHFLGSGQATTFITRMTRAPNTSASALFPAAADANHNVFYRRGGVARSLQEVYNLFKNKFSSTFFDTPAEPQPVLPERVPLPPRRPPAP